VKTRFRDKTLEMQGLNSRGSVDQIMKEVKKQGGLNAEIQSRIGHQLRAMYDDVVRQGVPDRFAELIKKLDGPEAAAQAAGQPDQTVKNDGRD
jgi:dihydroxyacid dehydratase/phosphogluconate dehydratase